MTKVEISDDLIPALDTEAEKQRRTRNNMVDVIVEQYIKRNKEVDNNGENDSLREEELL